MVALYPTYTTRHSGGATLVCLLALPSRNSERRLGFEQSRPSMHKWWGCLVAMLLGLMAGPTSAEYRGGPIKIGVLNDQSGLYADIAGTGSVWAAKKAVEDFGAAAKGMKVEIISADHLNKPDV